ncbi:hypothetical protein PV08_11191 [Exophiala spinifera]|uniref:Heterokaryon incompatibility domain-containing protein n=1 Tax=Exophiala spinifera TaxID=91928 RepID=A0A0D2AUP6_9EURO|nr:uncharacterized protein PV08_11191 [Exophiala spinifera]KIW10230.1 hypothetical protein PV08_11191 [Exophiala spinifera]
MANDLLYMHNGTASGKNTKHGEVYRRGWVVQELVLAPRIIHFGETQLVWECNELTASETYPYGWPSVAGSKLSLDPSCLQWELVRSPISESKGYHIWQKVVEKYSKCDLTREDEDKLVAISGLAKNLGPPEEYLAGLWKHDLSYQLLWKTISTESRRNNSGAPTWSWASISGPIEYRVRWAVNQADEEILVSVVDAATILKTADPTGSVRRGFVEIHGPLAKVEIQTIQPDERPPSHLINGNPGVVKWDIGQWNRLDWTKGHPSEVANTFWAMPIEIKQAHSCLVSGLVLEAIPGKPALRRVGFFSISNVFRPRGFYMFLAMLCHADYMPDDKIFAAGFCDELKQAPAIKRYRFLTYSFLIL